MYVYFFVLLYFCYRTSPDHIVLWPGEGAARPSRTTAAAAVEPEATRASRAGPAAEGLEGLFKYCRILTIIVKELPKL